MRTQTLRAEEQNGNVNAGWFLSIWLFPCLESGVSAHSQGAPSWEHRVWGLSHQLAKHSTWSLRPSMNDQ